MLQERKEEGEQNSASFPGESGIILPLGSAGACLFICSVEIISKPLYFPFCHFYLWLTVIPDDVSPDS